MPKKRCSKCDKDLFISSFYKRTGANSYHSACKSCEREMAKDWYERNKEKALQKVREWRNQNSESVKRYRTENRQKNYRQEVVRKYGVHPQWFDETMDKQRNACGCCERPFALGDKKTIPHVDHCHESKKVRGILCNRCNTVLGLCQDDEKVLLSLMGYLNKCHG